MKTWDTQLRADDLTIVYPWKWNFTNIGFWTRVWCNVETCFWKLGVLNRRSFYLRKEHGLGALYAFAFTLTLLRVDWILIYFFFHFVEIFKVSFFYMLNLLSFFRFGLSVGIGEWYESLIDNRFLLSRRFLGFSG